jgi:hypothetical protein
MGCSWCWLVYVKTSMRTHSAEQIGLLAFGIVAAMALILSGDSGGARAATTTIGRAATSLSGDARMNEVGNSAAGQNAAQDFTYQLLENPAMRDRH